MIIKVHIHNGRVEYGCDWEVDKLCSVCKKSSVSTERRKFMFLQCENSEVKVKLNGLCFEGKKRT